MSLLFVKADSKHYDKEKFVLSGLRYEAILICLDKEKGHKTEEGAKFKHWATFLCHNALEDSLHIPKVSYKIIPCGLPFHFHLQ
jgi:hypothetical protein